ncbi:MAG: hypothetical protein ACLR8P_02845 [Clostridium fessum]
MASSWIRPPAARSKSDVYAADQLTSGNQSEGIQALIERRSGADFDAQQPDLFGI